MYLGWFDPDKKRPASAKLAAACERYRSKFGQEPTLCLTHPDTAAALADVEGVDIQARNHVARNTFFVGRE